MPGYVDQTCSPPPSAPECQPEAYCTPNHADYCPPADCAPQGCDGLSLHVSLDVGIELGHDFMHL